MHYMHELRHLEDTTLLYTSKEGDMYNLLNPIEVGWNYSPNHDSSTASVRVTKANIRQLGDMTELRWHDGNCYGTICFTGKVTLVEATPAAKVLYGNKTTEET